MDQASRQRRARKKLESLEQDNFHDDPHADLVIKKYSPQDFLIMSKLVIK